MKPLRPGGKAKTRAYQRKWAEANPAVVSSGWATLAAWWNS